MKLHYDQEADAIYLRLREGIISESDEVEKGIVLDFDENGEVLSIEILSISKRLDALPGGVSLQLEGIQALG